MIYLILILLGYPPNANAYNPDPRAPAPSPYGAPYNPDPRATPSGYNPDPRAPPSGYNPDPRAPPSGYNPDPRAPPSGYNPDPRAPPSGYNPDSRAPTGGNPYMQPLGSSSAYGNNGSWAQSQSQYGGGSTNGLPPGTYIDKKGTALFS